MGTFRSAREFVNAALAHYRNLRSYADAGVVRPRHAARPLSCWFETQYQHPGFFRFQFIRPHPYRRLRDRQTKCIAGTDGSTPYFCTQAEGFPPVVTPEESLAMAVAGATGVSQGTAHTIAALLLPDVGGFNLTMLEKLRFRRSRVLDGTVCTVVSGLHPRGGRHTAWFGSNDFLLRKLIRHDRHSEEVRFDIRVNEAIPPERFGHSIDGASRETPSKCGHAPTT